MNKDFIKTKEFKILTTFIFIFFSLALIYKFYLMNRMEYTNYLVEKIIKDKQELICINEDTNEAYKTKNEKYEIIKTKTPCFNNDYEIKIFFPEKNKAFNILNCNLFK